MDWSWLVAIVVGVVALWAALLVLFWFLRPRGVPVRELIGLVPDIVRLLRRLVTDGATPLDVRLVVIGLTAWIISPIDLIPEFIPGLGPLDDVIVAVVAMRYLRRRLGLDGLRDRWTGTDQGFAILARLVGGDATPGDSPASRNGGAPKGDPAEPE